MSASTSNDGGNVDLTVDEHQALVLFEWLAKFNEKENGDLLGRAEQQVLFDLESQLESRLTAPLEPNYRELLEKAREAVCNGESGG